MGIVALIYAIMSKGAPWNEQLPILIFTILIMLAAAKWLEVPFIVTHLERLFERWSATKPKGDETE